MPVASAWARQHELDEDRFSAVLPKLLLRCALNGTPDAVVLCSMYRRSHIESNIEALGGEKCLSELIPSFMQLAAHASGVADPGPRAAPNRADQTPIEESLNSNAVHSGETR